MGLSIRSLNILSCLLMLKFNTEDSETEIVEIQYYLTN